MVQRLIMCRSRSTSLMDGLSFISSEPPDQEKELICLKLSDKDWHLIDALSNVFQIFFDATEVLSGSGYSRLARTYPMPDSLKSDLDSASTNSDENLMGKFVKKLSIVILISTDSNKYPRLSNAIFTSNMLS